MRLATLVVTLAAVAGCKKPSQAPTAATGSGSGSAVAQAGSGSAAPPAPAAGLAFDPADPDNGPSPLDVAFGGRHPRLPALSPDGTLYADYDDPAGGPMIPEPYDLVLRKVGADTVVEKLTILDFKEADSAGQAAQAGSDWTTPALRKTLADRGAKALARLQGFRSLDEVKFALKDSTGAQLPAKLGDLTIDPDLVELRDAQGTVLQSADLPDFHSSDDNCGYDPSLRAVYRDATTGLLYVEDSYRYRDDCEPPPVYVLVWSTDPAKADPAAAMRGVVAHQFDAVPAVPVATNNQPLPALAEKAKTSGTSAVTVTTSRDGTSAWASEIASDVARASDVLVKTPKGWQLAAAAWTAAVDNDDANHDAKAGKLHAQKLGQAPGDASLNDAFSSLTTDGVDAAAAGRADLVAIGSGPGERTVGGAGFARAWNAAWKGKVKIVSSVAGTTPSGTTGWVTASIELAKSGYKIPFMVFAVFDKTADGHWTLVHIHFAV